MKSYLKKMRQQVEKDLQHTARWQYFSPAIYAQYKVLVPVLKTHVHGKLLDIGCGNLPYRNYLINQVDCYDGLDFFNPSEEIKYRMDAEDLSPIGSESYDTAIMIEVLEHLSHPWIAIQEAYRILKPGGKLIVSVPHLSRLHDLPHDYFRFTSHGLDSMLSETGFTIIEILPKGGIFSFLGHQSATFFVTTTWGIPILKNVVYFLNSWLNTRLSYELDRLDKAHLAPLGYVAIGQKQ